MGYEAIGYGEFRFGWLFFDVFLGKKGEGLVLFWLEGFRE